MPTAKLPRRTMFVLLVGCGLVLILGDQPASAQGFWSPREVVLDTYTPPTPFACGERTCLLYELHVTNMDRYPLAIRSIEVLAERTTRPLKVYAGTSLAASLSGIDQAGTKKAAAVLDPGRRAILHVMIVSDRQVEWPESLSHRVSYAFQRAEAPEVEAETSGGVLRVRTNGVVPVLSPPLGDGTWIAWRGVSDGFSGHRRGAIRPKNGIPEQKARYAIDFIRVGERGETRNGPSSENESWLGYGSEVLAVARARVAVVQDGIPDSRPWDPSRLDGLTARTLAGNYVVLDLGGEVFALYGHLKPGSIRVHEGEQVSAGQVIGLVGNSGNSDAPHLHFQLNRGLPIEGEAVPYVFDRYQYIGDASTPGSVAAEVGERIAARMRSAGGSGSPQPRAYLEDMMRSAVADSLSISWMTSTGEPTMREGDMPLSNSVIRFVLVR